MREQCCALDAKRFRRWAQGCGAIPHHGRMRREAQLHATCQK
jgi:hypothetical protein